MTSTSKIDSAQAETNSPSTNFLARSKKLLPPPLCLPATSTMTEEEKVLNSTQQRERKKSSNNCCLSSASSDECPHQSVTYVLPVSRRPEILKTLITSSSMLLAPPPSETKHKKSYNAAYANQISLLKQRQPTTKSMINDSEWIDLVRLIIHRPLEDELKSLLDRYKTTYFDQVNAPNVSDDTIRSSLCAIVTEALGTYSSCSTLPATEPLSPTVDLTTNVSSPSMITATVNNGSTKRKRKRICPRTSISLPISINNQTKFVISHIIPGKYENTNGNKSNNHQQYKQFQKKYAHLFKYIPDKEEQAYLLRAEYLKPTSTRSPTNQNICLMLYDEVFNYIDDYDLELSGISLDEVFTLPESFLVHINSMSQQSAE
ncbi:unnamed protein product [Adineta ricciae]|uniref:Uncharacterized protein n=1 Tax=Adineta ricciae TaxID=249248 RepID=A0A814C0L8_ADIRI|nr:unnamed protein product [Adineta ricciae]